MARIYTPFKIPPDRLAILLARIIKSKTQRAEWLISTSTSYSTALIHFINWYRVNMVDFDDTPGIVKAWKGYATHQGSNQTSYRVVGNIALGIYDTMEALAQDGE